MKYVSLIKILWERQWTVRKSVSSAFRQLKGENTPGKNSNPTDFNEIKIILLMFTGIQDFYLGVYTDLIIGNCKSAKSYISSVNWYYFRVLIISHFSFLIALLSVFLKTYLYLYAAMSLI